MTTGIVPAAQSQPAKLLRPRLHASKPKSAPQEPQQSASSAEPAQKRWTLRNLLYRAAISKKRETHRCEAALNQTKRIQSDWLRLSQDRVSKRRIGVDILSLASESANCRVS
jgi:hypothetical protein